MNSHDNNPFLSLKTLAIALPADNVCLTFRGFGDSAFFH
jgi:hypothetical protein